MDEWDPRADRGPDRIAGAPTAGDDDHEVGALLDTAGSRPEIPREDLDAITTAARAAWRRQVEEVARRRALRTRTTVRAAAGVAALLVAALGALWWWSGSRSGGPGPVIAHVEAVSGSVRFDPAGGGATEVAEGLPLGPGAEIETAATGEAPGRLSLRLAGGATVRMDAGTRLRIASANALELRRGAVYLDTGTVDASSALGAGRIEVRSPVGTASDVGTRFAVRLLEPRASALRVRVRDGAVLVARRGVSYRADAGDELVLHGDGTVERRSAPAWGDDWSWVLAAAPRFDLEGRALTELLDWVARETGWSVRFEDERLATSAEEITLHGSLGDLRPDQAPFAVLPGAGLEGELDGGTLIIRRPQGP